MMRVMFMIGVAALVLAGCGKSGKSKSDVSQPESTEPAEAKISVSQSETQTPPAPSNVVPAKSTARQVIDGFTGKTAVEGLNRAKEKIQKVDKIEKGEKDDMDEILGP